MINSSSSVRANVADFSPYSPGLSIDETKEKFNLSHVIKMASNENPIGTSPFVAKAIADASQFAFRYPQSGCPKLTQAIAGYLSTEKHKISPKQIVLGNGSDEVIDLLIRCRCEPSIHNIVTFNPCFSLYCTQAKLCDVEIRQAPLNKDFSFNFNKIKKLIDENTAIVFITTPDNPSGYCPKRADVENFAKSLPQSTLLVIDEAYMDLSGDEKSLSLLHMIESFPNVAILRTFSKSFGLAGMRLGYGIMQEQLADYLCRTRPPFSINILAEVAGIAALKDESFQKLTKELVLQGRSDLSKGLAKMGFTVYPSWSNFIMVKPPQNGPSSDVIFNKLLERGIIIRQLKSYNLPENLRISIGNKGENNLFLKAVQEIINE